MKMKISVKIILIAVLGVIASSLIVLSLSTSLMVKLFDKTIQEEMSAMQSLISKIQQQDETMLLREVQLLVSLPDLINAVQMSDTAGILENTTIAWLRNEIDSITFTNSSGVTIARSHSDLKGDDISSRDGIQSALNGNVSSGVFFDENALLP